MRLRDCLGMLFTLVPQYWTTLASPPQRSDLSGHASRWSARRRGARPTSDRSASATSTRTLGGTRGGGFFRSTSTSTASVSAVWARRRTRPLGSLRWRRSIIGSLLSSRFQLLPPITVSTYLKKASSLQSCPRQRWGRIRDTCWPAFAVMDNVEAGRWVCSLAAFKLGDYHGAWSWTSARGNTTSSQKEEDISVLCWTIFHRLSGGFLPEEGNFTSCSPGRDGKCTMWTMWTGICIFVCQCVHVFIL